MFDRARQMEAKKEEQEMEGCTFEPLNPKKRSFENAGSSTMFDRARQMEAKKQERMKQIRQELFDKEMSQCSFQPRIVDPGSRRPSSVAASGGDRPSMLPKPSA